MTARAAVVVAALVAACSPGDDDASRITVGDIELVPPAGWQAQDLGASGRVWSPVKNPRKETITVIVGPTFVGSPQRALDRARVAQGVLRDGHLVASTPIVTAAGLEGIRFDMKFHPDAVPGKVYDRSHCVLIDGDRTLHVLYTADDPDPGRAVLDGVLASIRKGG